jgi:hypothetical protein
MIAFALAMIVQADPMEPTSEESCRVFAERVFAQADTSADDGAQTSLSYKTHFRHSDSSCYIVVTAVLSKDGVVHRQSTGLFTSDGNIPLYEVVLQDGKPDHCDDDGGQCMNSQAAFDSAVAPFMTGD